MYEPFMLFPNGMVLLELFYRQTHNETKEKYYLGL